MGFDDIDDLGDVNELSSSPILYPGFEQYENPPNYTLWPRVYFDEDTLEAITDNAEQRAESFSHEDSEQRHTVGLKGEVATAAYLSEFTYADLEVDMAVYDEGKGDAGYDVSFGYHYNVEVKTRSKIVDGDHINQDNIEAGLEIELPTKQIENSDYIVLAYPATPYRVDLCGWINQLQFWSRCEEKGDGKYEIQVKDFNLLPKRDIGPESVADVIERSRDAT